MDALINESSTITGSKLQSYHRSTNSIQLAGIAVYVSVVNVYGFVSFKVAQLLDTKVPSIRCRL